jgi:Fe2+ transport system protein FeoA
MKPLHKLATGERAYIVDLRDGTLCLQLFELGCFPGDLVEVKENCADKNSIIIVINNTTINLYKKAAETIITNTVSFEFSLN